MKITPLQQVILSVAVVAVVVVLAVVVLLIPQFGRLAALDSQISEANVQLGQQKALVEARKESKKRAAETDAHWLRLTNLVPSSPDLPSLIVELQDAAFASGVQIVDVNPSSPTATEDYYAIPIQMDVLGTWADTVDFLQRVIKLNRGIRIVDATASVVSNDSVENQQNEMIPDYSERTSVSIEAYMIPASIPATSTSTSGTAAPSSGN